MLKKIRRTECDSLDEQHKLFNRLIDAINDLEAAIGKIKAPRVVVAKPESRTKKK